MGPRDWAVTLADGRHKTSALPPDGRGLHGLEKTHLVGHQRERIKQCHGNRGTGVNYWIGGL